MEFVRAIIMGIVQGLTEFLPISSSGHLAIVKHILHIDLTSGLLFDVLLHLGTLIAIFVAYWDDIRKLIVEGFKIIGDFIGNLVRFMTNTFTKRKVTYKKILSTPYRRFVLLIIVSTIPTAIFGYGFQNAIEIAGRTLLVPGLCLVLTGILLLLADRLGNGNKTEATTGFKDAGFIGVAQGIATLPGLSRSGTTITACLLCGFKRDYAVKYSFIMSIPAVLGAVILELKDFSLSRVELSKVYAYIAGTIVAGIVGYICIKKMLVIVKGKKFKPFAYYCFAIGFIAVISHFVI